MPAIHDSVFVDDRDCEIEFSQQRDGALIFMSSEGVEGAKVELSLEQVRLLRDQLTEWLEDESCGS